MSLILSEILKTTGLSLILSETPKTGFVALRPIYCKFRNFRENFIFAKSVKTHNFDVEIHDKGVIYLISQQLRDFSNS